MILLFCFMISPYQKIIQLLNSHKIFYKEFKHQAVYTSEQAAKARGTPMHQGAKSLLLKGKQGFVLAVLPGDRKLDFKKLKNILGIKKIRFATTEEVREKMGCEVGACYPFGNIINLKTYVDESLSKNKLISFNPGLHTCSIEIQWNDFYLLVKPEIVDIAQ